MIPEQFAQHCKQIAYNSLTATAQCARLEVLSHSLAMALSHSCRTVRAISVSVSKGAHTHTYTHWRSKRAHYAIFMLSKREKVTAQQGDCFVVLPHCFAYHKQCITLIPTALLLSYCYFCFAAMFLG